MKRTILYVLAFVVFISSCKKTEDIRTEIPASPTTPMTTNAKLKQEFASSLVQALAISPALRNLIKTEALNQFDKDYDVLYEMIKDKELENGLTVKKLLLQFFADESKLEEIENELPLLTIFVPSLPENSFSAASWNTEKDIPEVGVSSRESNDVPMLKSDGSSYILASDKIPSFPVVVVKECERLVSLRPGELKKVNGSKFKSNSNKEFQFLDDCFKNSNSVNRYAKPTTISQKVQDAYDIYLNKDGWHRDYVYYGITPTVTSGQFSYDHKETITEFIMQGPGMSAYSKIADQTGDPAIVPVFNSGWTGGNFEFKVTVLFNSKNGLGTTYETYFPALPTDLFDLTYSQSPPFYNLESISYKPMNPNLQLFKWDLNSYSSTIKIDIEEVDQTETVVISETHSSKFASNFSIEPTSGLLKKIGLKFGASLETNNTSTFSRTFTQGNDKLGSVIVDFADKIIIAKRRIPLLIDRYFTQEYSTGYYKISVEPVKVQ